ncbi:MAG: serine/threonine protein kinase [Leptothrix sp. (in: Bacteria)]|nr:serine/threonine protein kinase [Leptothrix sp. (in: b-proteobacteria)]
MAHPEKLGKYKITGVLGEGAMGVVYRGFDPDIRRVVALKTIRRLGGDGAEAAQQSAARFRNEAQAAGRLLHPGIVGVYDFGDDGHVAYIAMEFVEGHTLSAYLSRRVAFSNADIASLAAQLLDALGHAHEHGVWHRDVKPSNVIMTRSGRIKIADFGIARTDTTGLTMANSMLGTPMYMAPEQFMGRSIDHRVDLYGAGVVLYQLVAGRAPFVGPPESLMYKVVNEIPLPPSAAEGARTGPLFDGVVARALAKDPAERWAHAGAFRDAVVRALGSTPPPAVSPETVGALPRANEFAPTERIPTMLRPGSATAAPPSHGFTGTGQAPSHWDPAVLAKVEAALARHVGPLASVMVRRAARECHDIPALYARLGEQITLASAREAFLHGVSAGHATGGTHGTHGGHGTAGSAAATGTRGGRDVSAPAAGAMSAGGPPVSDAFLDQAQRVLAAHVGPIAKVVVRRAAERTRDRQGLCALLADAVPDATRAAVLDELARL